MTYKILIVDDSKLARMAVAKVLNTLRPDWSRVEATNADEALALISQCPVDVALLDFNLPGRDGLELAAELRQAQPTLPIAVISANHQTEIVAKTKAVGATFLSKPLSEQALREFLDDAGSQMKPAAS